MSSGAQGSRDHLLALTPYLALGTTTQPCFSTTLHMLEFPGLLVCQVISELLGTIGGSLPNSPSQKGTPGNNSEGLPHVPIFDPKNATQIP